METARIPTATRKDGVTNTAAGWVGCPGRRRFLTLSASTASASHQPRHLDPRPATPSITSRYGEPAVGEHHLYANAGLPLNESGASTAYRRPDRKTDSAANPRLATQRQQRPPISPGGFLPRITPTSTTTQPPRLKGEAGGFSIDAAWSLATQVH